MYAEQQRVEHKRLAEKTVGDYSITVNASTYQPHGNYLCTISFPGLEKKVEIMHKVYKMPAIKSKPMHKKLGDDESSTTLDCTSEVSFPNYIK